MTTDFLNDDELKEQAPSLSGMKKENPFAVPDNYFDSLAENTMQKIQSIPDLERMQKENPFHVPEGYFDSLPSDIQQRIYENKKAGFFREWFSTFFQPRYSLAYATIIILVIFGIKYLAKPSDVTDPDSYLTCEEVKNSSCI